MQILYIDIYFLLNFTIDILSSFFSAKLLRIKTSLVRLVIVGSLGAITAIADIFIGDATFPRILFTISFLLLASIVIAGRLTVVRRAKFLLAFFIVEAVLGGIVHYAYSILDRYFVDFSEYLGENNNNRGALVFSLIILLSIGVLRIFIMLLTGNSNARTTSVRVKIGEVDVVADALVDSGNLVKDPMSMCPVIFIKESFAQELLPQEILNLENIDGLERTYQKRIRLVPVTRGDRTRVMTGLRPDVVEIISKDKKGEVDATVVIDKDGGSYGGFLCLVPSSIVDDV